MRASSEETSLQGRLAPCFEPLGLAAQSGRLAHASFRGDVGGRTVEVKSSVRSRHRFLGVGNVSVRELAGIYLNLSLPVRVRTRLVATNTTGALAGVASRLYQWQGMKRVDGVRPDARAVWASEPGWARSLFADANVAALFSGETDWSLILAPDSLALSPTTTLDAITPERARTWVDTAVRVAGAVESLPAPAPVPLTWLERKQQEDPKTAAVLLAVALLFGIPILVLVAIGLVLGTAFLLGGANAVAVTLILFAAVLMPVAMLLAAKRYLAS